MKVGRKRGKLGGAGTDKAGFMKADDAADWSEGVKASTNLSVEHEMHTQTNATKTARNRVAETASTPALTRMTMPVFDWEGIMRALKAAMASSSQDGEAKRRSKDSNEHYDEGGSSPEDELEAKHRELDSQSDWSNGPPPAAQHSPLPTVASSPAKSLSPAPRADNHSVNLMLVKSGNHGPSDFAVDFVNSSSDSSKCPEMNLLEAMEEAREGKMGMGLRLMGVDEDQ